MTIRQDMLIAASRAKNLLGDSAVLVAGFLRKQINPDGGFKNRFGQSDLYYTVFGIESLLALEQDIPWEIIGDFINRFCRVGLAPPSPYRWAKAHPTDLVHLACLVRCLADLNQPLNLNAFDKILPFIEKFRSNDGGYNNVAGAQQGTAYGCFLALGAYQDLLEFRIENVECRNLDSMAECVKSLQRKDGGYANEPSSKISSATATAAAVTILHYLNEPISESTVNWLFSCFRPKGGFAVSSCVMRDEYCEGKNTQYAIRNTQNGSLPDLLSTATALHALSLAGASIENIKEQCLDFLDSLWSPQGGFRGNWADEALDCEYTYYGLLALGHLNDKNPT